MKASLFVFVLWVLVFDADAQASDGGVGGPLPAWKKGELDIHHINTGRGEAQLLLLPDGTSLLVDTSGKTEEKPPFSLPTRPDVSRAPGEWVARYVQRVLPKPANRIDYVLLTHSIATTWAPSSRSRRAPRTSFEIRNLASNGNVWTGVGTVTRSICPPIERLEKDDYPIENKLSIALRVSYGRFDYFTGGDLSSSDEETAFALEPWKDIETPVVQACGPVEVMKANHHGSWDANSIPFLAALRRRVIVVGTRADGHPAINTWKRMTSTRAWSGPRDIFATDV